ncbi:MAG: MerR family copper efflux transcriptional regulator [Cocleimonas sp.]|jgi:MerR family copper efflux transcriptional regulator
MIYIGEASKLSGISIKAIRHYEKMVLLPNLVRSGSYRTFTQSDIDLIKLIKEARNIGFKISEFKQAFELNESWSWAEVEN